MLSGDFPESVVYSAIRSSILSLYYLLLIRYSPLLFTLDMAELRPKAPSERQLMEGSTHKLVVLPGLEVTQARQKPVRDVMTWVSCFSRFVAAMAPKFPESVPGFMSHLLIVLKAYTEVEDPAWRVYDEVFREKMTTKKVKQWQGMDVQLYQEICGGRPRRLGSSSGEGESKGFKKQGEESRKRVCWKYNEGGCSYGGGCKYPHSCELCLGKHPKSQCTKRQKL